MKTKPDLIIIGSGSTAFAAALRAASFGVKIMMFEKSTLGGTCINWGCIPSKVLIHSALFNHEARLAQDMGLGVTGTRKGLATDALFSRRENVVHKLRQERYLDVLKGIPGLQLIKGTARFTNSRTVECNGQHYSSERILVAVGGFPRVLDLPGLQKSDYLTSRSALLMNHIPQSLIIVGGGVIAVELGQMYCRFGCQVTILEHGPRLLPGIDGEVADALQRVLVSEGIRVIPNVNFCSVDKNGSQTVIYADVNGRRHKYSCEKLLLAVGTTPATAHLGLENAGVAMDRRGFITTDSYMRTSVDGIWAAGDVTGKMLIATVGAREAIVAVDDMFNRGCGCAIDYLAAPMAIFTDPEVGMIGHTEESAILAGLETASNCMPVSAIPKAHVTGHTAGVIKMIAEKSSGRLIGVHLACHRGAEMINEASLAIRMKATVEDVANTMHVYPSIGEGLRLCAQGFSRDISLLSCCAE